ncbi:MAG: hypothetical protein R2728_03670 [Chitinophagales bacterium]
MAVDPLGAIEEDGKLIGLGSNDAGAALVSLLATFLSIILINKIYHITYVLLPLLKKRFPVKNGIASIPNIIEKCDFAIVGEPTEMQIATAERGLMVVDAVAKGKLDMQPETKGLMLCTL